MSFCGTAFSQNVIDPVLQNILNEKSDEMIDINIIFKSQIDLTKLKKRSASISDKKVRRDALVDELKLFNEEKQKDVLAILRAEKSSNKVSNIRCHWLSNAITCTANSDVIYLLAKHPDIEIIGYDEMRQVIDIVPESERQTSDEEPYLTDNIIMVEADKVWEMGYTGKGVIVAVIDSGVNYNHADLADHLWDGGPEFPNHGYNVIDGNNDPMDKTGHGTHCAGTICGDGTSGIHTGMAPDATLMCVRSLDEYGYGSASSINAGMEFAIEHHADVLSMSLGILNASSADKTLFRNTCVNALELGIVAAVAAGNDGKMVMAPVPNNVRTPGNCPPPWIHPDQEVNAGGLSCVVCVGAIDYYENLYENGSMGPVTWSDTQFGDYPYGGSNIGLIRPDVCAPGVAIKSLDHDNNEGYNLQTGTSMATPCVAGVMALLLEKQNDLTPADICKALETTAKPFTETKNNNTGSGLINAYKAIASLNEGYLSFKSLTINDIDNGNTQNGKLNAGETVKLSVVLNNISEENYDNIKAVLSCENKIVTIIDAEAQINSIAANEEISLIDEFEISIDENVEIETQILFNLRFFDENENSIASFNFMDYTYNNMLQFSTFIVENDDNNNGVLEAGETADLGVILNNVGNEIAVNVEGILSCSDENIIINKNNANFGTIGCEASSAAFFNITVADDIDDNMNIPFVLTTNDLVGNENIFNSNYINTCNYIFTLQDYWGDGWDGAGVIVKFDGKEIDTLTILNGYQETFTFSIRNNVEVCIEWISGEYDKECNFFITKENGETIYISPEFQNRNTLLFSWVNDCSCTNESFDMCDAVKDISYDIKDEKNAEITWSAPENGNVLHYELYRNTQFIGTTEELSYTSEFTVQYFFSVRPVYDDCFGSFEMLNIINDEDVNDVDTEINASIYPNPSKDNFIIVCNEMTRISIYNIIGNKIMEKEINCDTYVVSGLESGVYFVEIESSNGKDIKRIVRF